ncbi:MAG: L-rhamnose/proton symporter RhaT [Bryobacteraceae bacterium]
MASAALTGTLLAVIGGLIHGSFAVPMKGIEKRWAWENIWLVYSVVGLICLPILLAVATVPALGGVYSGASGWLLVQIAIYGAGWGIGSTLFGLGISRVGMALGFAVILGMTSCLGSLIPMLALHPEDINTPKGHILLIGLSIVLAGIILCARAGALRDRDHSATRAAGAQGAFAAGFVICLLSGVLSPMLNFGFVFGAPVQTAAAQHGAAAGMEANAIWVPALAGGFVINAGYAIYRLFRNKTWGRYMAAGTPAWFWIGSALMGVLWFGGISTYGMGAAIMGPLGGVIAWPVFMSTVIVTANINGWLSGEWKGAQRSSVALSWAGLALLIVAIVVVARGA